MKIKRTHIAAGATVAALGVLAAVAIAAGSPEIQPASSAGTQTSPTQVSTVTEHRTVDVTTGAGTETVAASPSQPPATAPTTTTPDVTVTTSGREDQGRHADDEGDDDRGRSHEDDRDDDRGRDHDEDDRRGDDGGRDDDQGRDDDHGGDDD